MLNYKKEQGKLVIISKDTPNIDRLPQCFIYGDGAEAFYIQANLMDPYDDSKAYFPSTDREFSKLIYEYLVNLRYLASNRFEL